jgi:hypothetical protein
MKKSKVLEYFGNLDPEVNPAVATANALGISRQAVYYWGDNVPRSSQALIELKTKGEIKMDKAK